MSTVEDAVTVILLTVIGFACAWRALGKLTFLEGLGFVLGMALLAEGWDMMWEMTFA